MDDAARDPDQEAKACGQRSSNRRSLDNKMKKILSLLVLTLSSIFSFAGEEPEMADALYANGKIYIVVGVVVIIFIGIVAYLVMIDRKVSRMERERKQK